MAAVKQECFLFCGRKLNPLIMIVVFLFLAYSFAKKNPKLSDFFSPAPTPFLAVSAVLTDCAKCLDQM